MTFNRFFRVRAITAAVTAVLAAGSFTCPSGGQVRGVSPGLAAEVRAAWRGLGATKSACEEFDYFPDGGMRNFYCHLLNFMDYRRFEDLVGVPVFSAGPHGGGVLALDRSDSFGRYNPAFVARARQVLVPGAEDAVFRAATQNIYDEYIRGLARVFYVTYRKLDYNPSFLEREKARYLARMRKAGNGEPIYEHYFYFMNRDFIPRYDDVDYLFDNGFDGGWDGNVVKTCVAFWIRRSIDGTAAEFYLGLEKMMRAYDRRFLEGGAANGGDATN